MRYYVELEGRTFEVDIESDGLRLDGQPVQADLQSDHGSYLFHLVLDGRSHTLQARRRDGRGEWDIEVRGRRHLVTALDERRRAIRELAGAAAMAHGSLEVTAPMPGLVIAIEVSPNEEVAPGQGLAIIEAMKMENELKAPAAGRVAEVKVEAGQAVEKGETLLVIEPAAAE